MKTKEVSYLKTQWFKLIISITYFVLACTHLFSPAIDTSTLEGLQAYTDDIGYVVFYMLSSVVVIISSIVDYNSDRIEQLEKRISELERHTEDE